MKFIVIAVPDFEAPDEIAPIVMWVGNQLNEGYTSGHVGAEQHWSIEEDKK